ncbi:hypothetical protein A8H35_25935 [Burkholderia thailandensis]|nr:hypothetical protein WJ27_19685 [Burkholderia thailandensis]AWY61588.1 hypothetical protein A8H35_25935 [Burkholderia thailandensis]AWY65670.1 hypothetical protein A8H36_11100 [Burkholderia thailandensis]KVG19508.1 hypothetical protein WJ28_04865 [Burkholderia thailandensis]NOK44680.1 hypothetical protein [Burkholderia thailandensis]
MLRGSAMFMASLVTKNVERETMIGGPIRRGNRRGAGRRTCLPESYCRCAHRSDGVWRYA